MADRRGAYMVLVGRCEEKRLFGKPRHRWRVNSEVGCVGKDLNDLA
jgi:hypothetical protein